MCKWIGEYRAITLTTGTDNFTGTAGNDTFSGVVVGDNASTTTLNPGDALSGGAGTDTLNISISGARTAGVLTTAFTLTGIENVLVSNYATGNLVNTIDLAGADTSLAKVGLTSSSTAGGGAGSTKFDNVQKIVDVELKNGGANFEIVYAAAAVAGTTDVQKVTLSNHSLTGNNFPTLKLTGGIETLAITSTGGTNKIQLDAGNRHTKVTVEGDKALTLDVNDTTNETIATVDASTFTGNLTLSGLADATVVKLNVIGGAGNDTVTLPANFSSNDSIDGGAGTNTLKIGGAITAANLVNVKNFQVLELSGTADDQTINVDASAIAGVTKVVSSWVDGDDTDSTDSAITFSNLGAGTALAITDGNSTTTVTGTLKTDTTADSIDVTIGKATATATTGVTIKSVTLNNHETLNVASTGGTSAAANTITTLTSSNATKLNVTGDRDLTITNFTGSSSLKTVDASALTGKLIMGNALTAAGNHTLTGGSGADTLRGSTGNDVIVGGAGNDSIVGGGGVDSIDGGDGDDSIELGTGTASKVVTVTGGAGSDTVTLTNGTGSFNINLGDGDDTIKVASGSTLYIDGDDTIVGGAGTDALSFVAANSQTINLSATTVLSNVSGFENVVIDVSGLTANNNTYSFTFDDVLASGVGAGTLNIFVKDATVPAANAGADVTINAAGVLLNSTKVNVNTAGAAVQYIYHVGGATENVVLGAQDDIVRLATAGHLTANDTIDAGAGADILALNYVGSTDVTINASTWANVKGFETINLDGVNGEGTGAIVFNLTDVFATNNRDLSNNTLAVTRYNAVTGTTADDMGTTKIDGSAVVGTKLVLAGAKNADTIIGGGADDTITGNGGNDSLTGGAGNDTFVATASMGIDTITDMNFGTSTTSVDKINVAARNLIFNSSFDTVVTDATAFDIDEDVLIITSQTFVNLAAVDAFYEARSTAVTGTSADKLILWQDSMGKVHLSQAVGGSGGNAGEDNNDEWTLTDLFILENVTVTGIATLVNVGDFVVTA